MNGHNTKNMKVWRSDDFPFSMKGDFSGDFRRRFQVLAADFRCLSKVAMLPCC